MKVKDMKIMDVLQLDAFQSALTERVSAMRIVRERARIEYGNRLASHPIDELIRAGKFNAGDMTVLYAACLDRKCLLSRSQREFILGVCQDVFNKTVKNLLEAEKTAKKPAKKKKSVTLSANNQQK